MENETASRDLIQQTIQYYFDGLYNSDPEKLRIAFHPNSQISGYFKGALGFQSLEGFLKYVKAIPAPSQNGEEYDMKILSIDITGNEAVVKTAELYLGLKFTDYLSMLNVDGKWVIVNKIYYYEPKE